MSDKLYRDHGFTCYPFPNDDLFRRALHLRGLDLDNFVRWVEGGDEPFEEMARNMFGASAYSAMMEEENFSDTFLILFYKLNNVLFLYEHFGRP
jgi:hypothetical protein